MYAAPSADLTQEEVHHIEQTTKFFSWSGRIGRLRFLCYVMAAASAGMLVGGISMGIAFAVLSRQFRYVMTIEHVSLVGICVVLTPLLGALMIYSRRRLHDLNITGWVAILWLLPFLSMLPAAMAGHVAANNEILGLIVIFCC